MEELGERDEAEVLAQVEARLPREHHGLDRGNRVGESPITERGSQQLHFLVEQGEEQDRVPVADETKNRRQRRGLPERHEQGADGQVRGDEQRPGSEPPVRISQSTRP